MLWNNLGNKRYFKREGTVYSASSHSFCAVDYDKEMSVAVSFAVVPSREFPVALFLLLTAIAGLILYSWTGKKKFYNLAAKIPGPPALPIIGNALEFIATDNKKLIDQFMSLMDRFGGTARIWLGPRLLVFISNPKDIEICLNSGKLVEKNEMYSFFDDMLGQGLLNASGDIWKKHRRIIAPTFHASILKHYVEIFDRQSQTLVTRLEKQVGKNFNVFPFVRDCALDFITETALETTIDAQGETVSESTLAAERMMHITFDRIFKIWLHSDHLFYLTKNGREYLKLRKIVRDTTEPMLQAKKIEIAAEEAVNHLQSDDSPSKRRSFFRLLVDLNENGENFNDQELRDEVMTIIITGYETTAATIAFVLVMLGIHQDVQNRLYDEVRDLKDRLGGKSLQAFDLDQLQYMDMVIKETLRLYPVGPVIFRKATADVPLATCTVPKGSSVIVVFLHTHRDPGIWNNPLEFNPENFLPTEVSKRHPYSFNPFSGGPRGCIGQKYAQMSMKVMLFNILSKFQIQCDRKMSEIGVKIEVTLKMEDGFVIRLEPRQ